MPIFDLNFYIYECLVNMTVDTLMPTHTFSESSAVLFFMNNPNYYVSRFIPTCPERVIKLQEYSSTCYEG